MKGVILAGGNGTRLRPLTEISNKHLLPVYDKPMILYPLQTLKNLEITNILVVSGGEHIGKFAEYLGDGSAFGVNITYKVQKSAGGIADALLLAEDFVGDESVTVILGDNVFDNMTLEMPPEYEESDDAIIFGKRVSDPERFGVVEIENDTIVNIVEKPESPPSNIAVTGLYVYPPDVFDYIKTLSPSGRGELEITDVNNHYVKQDRCLLSMVEGFWSDAGTFESLLRSANWASIVQNKNISS